MDFHDINTRLSSLLKSENGCEYTDIDDGIINNIALYRDSNINVLHLNIRSFMKNVDSLWMLLNELQEKGIIIHVIGICESFLNKDSVQLAKLDNYQCIHKYRQERIGGGVSVLLHNSVKLVREIDTPFNDYFESLTVEIKYRNHHVLISEHYKPPNTKDSLFKENLLKTLDITKRFKTCYLSGDYNYDLIKVEKHAPMSDFVSTMFDYRFIPCISKPTRTTYTSSTLLDNVFVKHDVLNPYHSFVITDQMSDHFPCLVLYQLFDSDSELDPNVYFKRRKLDDQ